VGVSLTCIPAILGEQPRILEAGLAIPNPMFLQGVKITDTGNLPHRLYTLYM